MSAIRFEHVSFSYGVGDAPRLEDVSFAIAPGEMVALVGPLGAGKRACAHLLLRQSDPDRGRITLGGVDVRELSISALRRLIMTVPQDMSLRNATIASSDASIMIVDEAALNLDME